MMSGCATMMRMAVFDTPSGAVTVSFPNTIDSVSVDDLREWFPLMLRSLGRIAERNADQAATSGGNISKIYPPDDGIKSL